MTKLVANEYYKYYKTRLPNDYLISANVYMSQASYGILKADVSDQRLIQNAIDENQFSTGAINHLCQILDQATMTKNISRTESLAKLKVLLNKWLMTLDLNKAVIR